MILGVKVAEKIHLSAIFSEFERILGVFDHSELPYGVITPPRAVSTFFEVIRGRPKHRWGVLSYFSGKNGHNSPANFGFFFCCHFYP